MGNARIVVFSSHLTYVYIFEWGRALLLGSSSPSDMSVFNDDHLNADVTGGRETVGGGGQNDNEMYIERKYLKESMYNCK